MEQTWSVRSLQRNISLQYYQRMLMSQHKDVVKAEMQEITRPLQDRLEFIKNPVVAEFLGLSNNADFTETKLEQSIITHVTICHGLKMAAPDGKMRTDEKTSSFRGWT